MTFLVKVMPFTSTMVSHDVSYIGVMWHHCIDVSIIWTVPSVVQLHFLSPKDENDVQHDFFGNLMSLALASVSPDVINIIKRSQWLFGHVMPLVLASVSCDVNDVNNGAIAFLRSTQLKSCATSLFGHWQNLLWCLCYMIPTMLSTAPLHSLGQGNWNEVQHDFRSFDATCTGISITSFQQHHQCHHSHSLGQLNLRTIDCLNKNARKSIVIYICEQSAWLVYVRVLYNGFLTEHTFQMIENCLTLCQPLEFSACSVAVCWRVMYSLLCRPSLWTRCN